MGRSLLVQLGLIGAAVSGVAIGSTRAQPAPRAAAETARLGIDLAGEVELSRLVELISQRLGVSVQYQARDLAQKVTLRLRDELDDADLWRILAAVLESHGMAIVESEHPGLFRIVPLAQAAAQNQRLLLPGEAPAEAGPDRARSSFVSAVVRLRSADAAEVATALQPILTPQTGAAKAIGPGGLLLVTDVRRRVEQALSLIEYLDAAPDPVTQFTVSLQQAAAPEVAALLQQVLIARQTMEPRTVSPARAAAGTGVQAIALPDGRRLLVLAPASREQSLRNLIAELDVRDAVETRVYSTPAAAPEDLAAVIRELLATARRDGAAGQIDGGRVFVDRLSGSVMVTAPLRDHVRIAELVARVEAAPASSRQTMRSFTIRNRSASDLRATLEQLMETVALGAGASPAGSPMGYAAQTGEPRPGAASPATSAQAPAPRTTVGALSLTVDEPTNTLIAIGSPSMLAQIEALIGDLDRRQPQVMIEVSLVSMSESEALDIGVELRGEFEIGTTSVNLSSLFGLGMGGPLAGGTGFTGAVVNPGDFQALIRAVETVNRGRTVSAPKALVNNNATTTLRAVAREPFTSLNASDTVATTSFGGTQDAGTTITVTPQIAEGDHLLLEYAIELSAFTGESTTVQGGGVIPPPSQQNSVDGSVTIPDGFTVVIGGIDNVTDNRATTRVPLIGRIPLLGALFGTTGESDSRSRFYVFIRATVLRDPGFEDLRTLSAPDLVKAGVPDGTPSMRPLWIE